MLIETVTSVASKVLTGGNSTATGFAGYAVFTQKPGLSASNGDGSRGYPANPGMTAGDGFILSGDGGAKAENRIKLIPYSEGPPLYQFRVRVYDCVQAVSDLNRVGTWLALLQAEFLCSTSEVTGYAGGTIAENERLCDGLTPTAGVPGCGPSGIGFTVTTYQNQIAYAVVALPGPRLVAVDFAPDDPGTVFGMNALWAVA